MNKIEKKVEFFLVPNIGRTLFIGIDFMRSFNVLAVIECLLD